ncbi:MAG: DUF1674 domain-containing protein [Gammaproteobacteria bacterium]|jgi:hypothetical protein
MTDAPEPQSGENHEAAESADDSTPPQPKRPQEIGGRKGPEPTRFGDWEKNGRCIDF